MNQLNHFRQDFILINVNFEVTACSLNSEQAAEWMHTLTTDLLEFVDSPNQHTSLFFESIYTVRLHKLEIGFLIQIAKLADIVQQIRKLAHDLKNPTQNIVSLIELIENEYKADEQLYSLFKMMKQSAQNALLLVQHNLNLGKSFDNVEQFNLSTLIKQVLETFLIDLYHKSIKIALDLDGEIECNLSRDKLFRILSNLISNAIKFSHENQRIYVQTINEKLYFKLIIRDEGIGMPDNLKNEIFNPLVDKSRMGTMGEKSNGLGMMIVKNLIEELKGTVKIDSKENEGTCFELTLPKQLISLQ